MQNVPDKGELKNDGRFYFHMFSLITSLLYCLSCNCAEMSYELFVRKAVQFPRWWNTNDYYIDSTSELN